MLHFLSSSHLSPLDLNLLGEENREMWAPTKNLGNSGLLAPSPEMHSMSSLLAHKGEGMSEIPPDSRFPSEQPQILQCLLPWRTAICGEPSGSLQSPAPGFWRLGTVTGLRRGEGGAESLTRIGAQRSASPLMGTP